MKKESSFWVDDFLVELVVDSLKGKLCKKTKKN
jgi:hypothetical protein